MPNVEGIGCTERALSAKPALKEVANVSSVEVDVGDGAVIVQHDEKVTGSAQLIGGLESVGRFRETIEKSESDKEKA